MDKNALIKYLCALLLFGLNGIVASHIALNSYEIVFLRTMIGSALLILLFLLRKNRFHMRENKSDVLLITLSGMAMGASWMFLYEAYQRLGVSFAALLYYCGPVIVMILSPVLFQERLTKPKVAGFAIVLIGIVLDVFLYAMGSLAGQYIMYVGIALYGLSVLFMLVTLPVEYNASSRAKKMLVAEGILTESELPAAKKVLSAAALTYVASMLISLVYFLRYLVIVLAHSRRR